MTTQERKWDSHIFIVTESGPNSARWVRHHRSKVKGAPNITGVKIKSIENNML